MDIFVVLTKLQKKLLHTLYHKKHVKFYFRMKIHNTQKKTTQNFYLHLAWAFDNYQLLDAEM